MALVKNTPTNTPPLTDSTTLAETIRTILNTFAAENIITCDLRAQSTIADYMIIASGTSRRQLDTYADKIQEACKRDVLSIEGQGTSDWVLLDCGVVIVHLFLPELRAFYNLEKMWG